MEGYDKLVLGAWSCTYGLSPKAATTGPISSQDDDGLTCPFVVATLPALPNAVVLWCINILAVKAPWNEAGDLCARMSAPIRVPMCLLHGPEKLATVIASRPVPSQGPSLRPTSVQLFMFGGWCYGSSVSHHVH